MQPALETLNNELERTRGLRLAMRVGIHTGPVVVSFLGERKGQDFVVVGDSVNLTSRLQAAAPPGGLLISHDTYRHVRGIFDVRPLEPLSLKGKREPVQAYLVLTAKPRAFRTTTRGVEGIDTRMVGREADLQRLQEAVSAAFEDGELQMVMVIGEAGIGKSRLLAEFNAWAELIPERIRYFKGRAVPAMQNLPNSLLRDLFSFRFQIQDSDPPPVVWEKMEQGIGGAASGANPAAISRIETGQPQPEPASPAPHSEINMRAHFIGQLLGFDFSDSPFLSGLRQNVGHADYVRQIRDRAMVYLIDYFKSLSEFEPVMLMLEDLHWADDSSLDILEQLSAALVQQRLLIICAARSSFFERRPPWKTIETFRRQVPNYSHIYLQPLSRRESRRLVEDILQKVDDLPGELSELVVNSAEGNPFYVEELIKMLIEDGVIIKIPPAATDKERWQVNLSRLVAAHIPPTLTGVLQARFDSLPAAERLLLQRASVIGRVFWDQAIEFLENQSPIDETGEDFIDHLSAVLASLGAREMIYLQRQSAFDRTHEYLFKHALQRDVTYESVLKRERRIYHAGAARWLEKVTRHSQRADEYATLIAGHYDLAGETGPAAAWYQRAGVRAAAQFANAEALRLFDRSLELTPPDQDSTRFAILLEREKIYDLRGEREAQNHDLEALTALAEKLDDDRRRAVVNLHIARLAEATGDYTRAIQFARRAVEFAHKTGAGENEANGYLSWGGSLWRQAEFDAARQQYEQALRLSRTANLPGVEADALRGIGVIYEVQGNYPQAGEYLRAAQLIYHRINDRSGEGKSLNSLGVLTYHLGDDAKAREYYEAALRVKNEIGDRYGEGIALTNLGILAQNQGDTTASQNYLNQSVKITREINDREGEATALSALGASALYLGQFQTAQSYFEHSLSICQEIGDRQGEASVLACLAQLCYYQDDDQACVHYGSQGKQVAIEASCTYELPYALTWLAYGLRRLGHFDEALAAHQQACQLRLEQEQPAQALENLAGAARVNLDLGLVAQAEASALSILEEIGKLPARDIEEPARIYLACYQILKAAGNGRARDALKSACAWVEERASRIEDRQTRQSFLENVPTNREALAEWGKAAQAGETIPPEGGQHE